MFSETEVYDALRLLVFGAFGLSFGLSFFSFFALWRFMRQHPIPNHNRFDQNCRVPMEGKRTPTAGR